MIRPRLTPLPIKFEPQSISYYSPYLDSCCRTQGLLINQIPNLTEFCGRPFMFHQSRIDCQCQHSNGKHPLLTC